VDIVVAGIAVVAFAATVLVLVGAANRAQRAPSRTVGEIDVDGDGWLTTDQVAELLAVSPAEVMAQVERDAIPHFIVVGGARSEPAAYRFRRDEIEAWTIG
jgi:hypothetical protein